LVTVLLVIHIVIIILFDLILLILFLFGRLALLHVHIRIYIHRHAPRLGFRLLFLRGGSSVGCCGPGLQAPDIKIVALDFFQGLD